MGWDDLFGEGCVWLCRAAQSYDPTQAQFSAYAKKVVRNGLISYCRSLNGRERHTARLTADENGDLFDRLALSDAPDDFEAQIAEEEVLELLHSRAEDYSGVARLGIEALELKVKGMSITEMANLYNVPPSHVGAWISRSAQKLRRDEKFLAAFRSCGGTHYTVSYAEKQGLEVINIAQHEIIQRSIFSDGKCPPQ